MENTQPKNVAMFIDCDNVSAKYIDSIFKDLSQYGRITIRKAYGDWTNKHLHGWENVYWIIIYNHINNLPMQVRKMHLILQL